MLPGICLGRRATTKRRSRLATSFVCVRNENGWVPFTEEDIKEFYTRRGPGDGFWWNRLLSQEFIVEKDGLYFVTHQFIARCFTASPVSC